MPVVFFTQCLFLWEEPLSIVPYPQCHLIVLLHLWSLLSLGVGSTVVASPARINVFWRSMFSRRGWRHARLGKVDVQESNLIKRLGGMAWRWLTPFFNKAGDRGSGTVQVFTVERLWRIRFRSGQGFCWGWQKDWAYLICKGRSGRNWVLCQKEKRGNSEGNSEALCIDSGWSKLML